MSWYVSITKNIENKIIIKKIIFKNLQKDSAKEEIIKKNN